MRSILLPAILFPVFALSSVRSDSLIKALEGMPADSNRVNVLYEIAWNLRISNPKEGLKYGQEGLALAHELGSLRHQCLLFNTMGVLYKNLGELEKSIENLSIALSLSRKLGDEAREGSILNNIGNIYYLQDNYSKAIEIFLEAKKLTEKRGDQRVYSSILANLGNVYYRLREPAKALDYYNQAMIIMASDKNKMAVAMLVTNIGNCYMDLNMTDSAIAMANRIRTLFDTLADRVLYSRLLSNLAGYYINKKDHNAALGLYRRAEMTGGAETPPDDLVKIKVGIGVCQLELGNQEEAERYLHEGLRLCKEFSNRHFLRDALYYLAQLYERQGKNADALRYFREYMAVKDSIQNDEVTRKTTAAELNYAFGKKEETILAEQARREAEAESKLRQQKLLTYSSLLAGLLLLSLFILAYRSYRMNKKARMEIAAQKTVIEEKNKSITDSIEYARKIQESLLPKERLIERTIGRLKG